jgi:hypothetical protein
LLILNVSRQNYQNNQGEERLNAQTLEAELQQLAEMAGPEQAILIQNYIATGRAQALALKAVPAAQAERVERYHGWFGGAPLLPQNFDWPRDRAGTPMLFIAQFDLGRLPATDVNRPKQGLLTIFRSTKILTMPAKDRRSFHIFYLPEFDYDQLGPHSPHSMAAANLVGPSDRCPEELASWAVLAAPVWTVSEQLDGLRRELGLSQNVVERLRAWAKEFNAFYCGNNRLFGAALQGLAEQKEICAFAASGISHSTERARDDHYSHLVAEAPAWLLLARVDEVALFGAGSTSTDQTVAESRLLIRCEDLEHALFERAWVICLSALN